MYFDDIYKDSPESVFLPTEVDEGKLSVQPKKGRLDHNIKEYFKSTLRSFNNHVGYYTFFVDDCHAKNITCCDETVLPNYFHAIIECGNDKKTRLLTAEYLYSKAQFVKY